MRQTWCLLVSNKPPTIAEQAEFLEYLLKSGRMADGRVAGERWIRITKEQHEELLGIQLRLERMAPFEDKIRKMVIGR